MNLSRRYIFLNKSEFQKNDLKRRLYIIKKVIIVSFISLILALTGCGSENNSKNHYNLDEFESDMKDKGYGFEIQDVSKDFLPTTRKRMIFNDIALDIYIFSSNKKMESEASKIDSNGCNYNNVLFVSWFSYPHFYKKGRLIVQYIGENEKIISELEDILGEQFAGLKP